MKRSNKTREEIVEIMMKDKAVRKAIVKQLPGLFFNFYFPTYQDYPTAPFHKELFGLSKDQALSMVVVSGFRNSGKSTIMSLSYPIWAIIGEPQAKYVVIMSETQLKAQTILGHIKNELENNALLKKDLGPFQEDHSWNATSLTLTNYNAKITAISTDQSLRGMRHLSHRPDLIIIDDSESAETVRTMESRDKLYRKVTGDIIPAGHSKTKVVVIGSILHEDGLIRRLQKGIDGKEINGKYRMYPIVDEYGQPLWPGKFPDQVSIEAEKARGIPDREWQVEYMLQPVSDEYQVIKQEWIQYYDRLPDPAELQYRYAMTGVDPAISKESTADYTAMVSGIVTKTDNEWSLYIVPHPINERLNGPEIQERVVEQSMLMGRNGDTTDVAVEDLGFQELIIDLLRQKNVPVEGISPGGNDKRARLSSISGLIRSGKILFSRHGDEKLIQQLVKFGTEKHDDLSDALVILVTAVIRREGNNTLIVPKIEVPKVLTQKQEEDKADQALILEQQYELQNFRRMMGGLGFGY